MEDVAVYFSKDVQEGKIFYDLQYDSYMTKKMFHGARGVALEVRHLPHKR